MASTTDTTAEIDRFAGEYKEWVRTERARMKEEGVEPSPEAGRFGCGSDFRIEIAPFPDGRVDFRMSAHDLRSPNVSPYVRIGGIHPWPGLILQADALLKAFANVWPSLAASYLGAGNWPDRFEMDLGSEVVTFENREGELFVGVDGRFASQGEKGLLVVEAIRAIADQMCRRRMTGWDDRLEWYEASTDTDLPPATMEEGIAFGFDPEAERIVHKAETKWFAERHAQTPKEWIALATWLQAKEIVASADGQPAPTTDADWHPDAKTDGRQIQRDDGTISFACRIKGWTIDELRREATVHRNQVARGIDVWEHERLRREASRA